MVLYKSTGYSLQQTTSNILVLLTVQSRSQACLCVCVFIQPMKCQQRLFLLLRGRAKENLASSVPAICTVVSVGYGVCLYLVPFPLLCLSFQTQIHCGFVTTAAKPHQPLNTMQSTYIELRYTYVIKAAH